MHCMYMCRKGGKLQKRGKINLIGRLQLTTEKTKEEDNESIVALRILRTQVCVCVCVCVCACGHTIQLQESLDSLIQGLGQLC